MAELILTEEEKTSATFLEWDNESLGNAVKAVAAICNDNHGEHALKVTGAAVFLVSDAVRNDADVLTVKLSGVTSSGHDLGDWKITIERIQETEP